jgi:hypothetical protein
LCEIGIVIHPEVYGQWGRGFRIPSHVVVELKPQDVQARSELEGVFTIQEHIRSKHVTNLGSVVGAVILKREWMHFSWYYIVDCLWFSVSSLHCFLQCLRKV